MCVRWSYDEGTERWRVPIPRRRNLLQPLHLDVSDSATGSCKRIFVASPVTFVGSTAADRVVIVLVWPSVLSVWLQLRPSPSAPCCFWKSKAPTSIT